MNEAPKPPLDPKANASDAPTGAAHLPHGRRRFLRQASLGSAALALGSACTAGASESNNPAPEGANAAVSGTSGSNQPVVLSTWYHGLPANSAAWQLLNNKGSALDAVEAGVRVPEADPESNSVGYGGLPDRDGRVTLDACIMDHQSRCGGVCFLEGYKHPISVARKVMEETPHVLMAGEGAARFAAAHGFQTENLLTPEAEAHWREWLKEGHYAPPINAENHDTIGMLALDAQGQLAGACTTSGLAYKMHGRVGDSPLIGAGLFVDGAVGGATATGLGEMVIKTCGSFLVVELMRQGASPQEACEAAVRRMAERQDIEDRQVGFLALDRQGRTGAFAIRGGFNYALTHEGQHGMQDALSLVP